MQRRIFIYTILLKNILFSIPSSFFRQFIYFKSVFLDSKFILISAPMDGQFDERFQIDERFKDDEFDREFVSIFTNIH